MATKTKPRGYWREKIETVAGSRWHKLTAIRPGAPYMTPNTGQVRERWVYRCDCGSEVVWQPSTVRSNVKRGWCSCPTCFKAAHPQPANDGENGAVPMATTKTIYAVFAPAEGDSPEDATWWYFNTRELADDFANDDWGADYGVTNYSESGPFRVDEQRVSSERYAKTSFMTKTKLGAWERKKP